MLTSCLLHYTATIATTGEQLKARFEAIKGNDHKLATILFLEKALTR